MITHFYRTLTCLFFLCPLFISAALPADQLAPLRSHLLEVNAQWEKYLGPADFREDVAFIDDVNRIQTHLFLVESRLREQVREGIPANALKERLRLLEELHSYAQNQRFPQNTRHQTRIPYFIDDQGTACAVGHLMQASGEADFAEHIRSEQNNAYVLDMNYPELNSWASSHGFEAAELALIQPGYQPGYLWSFLPGGIPNGNVNQILKDPQNNRLFIHGVFTDLSGMTTNGMATWDGQNFVSLGTDSPVGELNTVAYFNGLHWFGGQFSNNNGANIATWDGTTWSYYQVYTGTIHALEVFNGELYAGGNLTFSGGALVAHILRLNNGLWTSVGQGFDAPVYALEVKQNTLYAGGEFSQSGSVATPYVAQWDGQQWQPVGNSGVIDDVVKALAVNNDTLYAGGALLDSTHINVRYGLARLEGNSWMPQLQLGVNYDRGPFDPAEIDYIDFRGNDVYVAGSFIVPGFITGNDFAKVIPGQGFMTPVCLTDTYVFSVASLNNLFIMGGGFTIVNSSSISYLAGVDVATHLDPEQAQFSMYPSPFTDRSRIDLPAELQTQEISLKAFDLQGRNVKLRYEQQGGELIIHRDQLSSGRYLLMLEAGGVVQGSLPFQVQ